MDFERFEKIFLKFCTIFDDVYKRGTQNVIKEIFGTVKDDCQRNLADSEKDEQEAAAE